MTPDELRDDVAAGAIDTVVVAFTDHHGRAMGKRLDAGFFISDGLDHGTHACDYLFTVDMEMSPVSGYEFASWDQGYGDVHLVPDLATLRRAGWADRTAFVWCDVHNTDTGDLAAIAPRSILRRQIDRLAEHGLIAQGASELEFFLYDDSYRAAHDLRYDGLTSAGWYNEDYDLLQGARVEPFVGAARRALTDSEVPVESSKGEAARGQHELNISYCDVLAMADRHAVLKQALKELAVAHGLSLTFMAKPSASESGSSCHIHLSLWEHPEGADRASSVFDGRTDRFRWFLGGWMARAAELSVFNAPTINSYKRYTEGSWAPTRIAWSDDNRTVAFRVVGTGESLRIECRLPGADANPYLAYAAALAAGLEGIEEHTEPPQSFDGDAYGSHLPHVPRTLEHAVALFDESTFARATFGDEVVDHYTHTFTTEVEAFRTAVTDWERLRYFERI